MDDDSKSELLQGVKDLCGTDAAGTNDAQLTAMIDSATAYVGTFKPPESAVPELVKLWVAHSLRSKVTALSQVKVNGVQVTHASGNGGDDWLMQFNRLISSLGLGLAEVTGW